MTDNYDMEPHEHDAHVEDEHQPKAEAWPDDQPPVDDFADHGAEETATSSEEMGTHQEEIMDSEPRRSSPLLPILAGVGGLLFLGAILYWQFGRTPSVAPSVPAPPPLQIAQAPIKPVAPPTTFQDTAVTPKETPPDLGSVMKQTATTASTTDVAPKTSYTATNQSVAMPTPVAAPVTPVTVTAPPASTVSVSVSSTAPTMLPPPSANVTVTNTALETRVNDLSTRMEALKKQMDQANQQLGQLNTTLASASLGGNNTGGNTALDERLAKIEQQMGKTASDTTPAVTAMADPTAMQPEMSPSPMPEIKTPVVHRHKTHVVKVTHKPAHRAVHTVAVNWVLRAATPTDAWVAKNDSTPELHHIRIGDELAGIGHVTAIHQNGDSWVIEGSAGTIH